MRHRNMRNAAPKHEKFDTGTSDMWQETAGNQRLFFGNRSRDLGNKKAGLGNKIRDLGNKIRDLGNKKRGLGNKIRNQGNLNGAGFRTGLNGVCFPKSKMFPNGKQAGKQPEGPENRKIFASVSHVSQKLPKMVKGKNIERYAPTPIPIYARIRVFRKLGKHGKHHFNLKVDDAS